MKLSKTKTKWNIQLGITFGAIILALLLSLTNLFKTLELKSIDSRFTLRGSQTPDECPVIIVAIDDQSDESTPDRWPWPRSYYAHVIENLFEAGASAVGLDVMLDQSDVFNPQSDDILAETLKKYENVVLTGKIMRTSIHSSYSTLIPPFEKFVTEKGNWGLAALEADIDGFYRRYPFVQAYNDSLLPSFSAEILRKYLSDSAQVSVGATLDFFTLGDYLIPKLDETSMLINFSGPAFTFPYYSFDNLLDDTDFDLREDYDMDLFDDPGDATLGIPPGLKYSGVFKDKIVLIGSSMHELHDNFPTPFLEHRNREGKRVLAEMPGVEIHANAINTVLSGNYITNLPRLYLFLILLTISIIIFLFNKFFSTTWSAISSVLLIIVYLILATIAFSGYSLLFPVVTPVLTLLFCYLGYTGYSYILSQHEKKMLRGAFAHYVPDSVIKDIISNPDKLKLGGEERVVSVMFTDVAGFTTISESLSPRELVSLLNEYLTEMTDIVIANKGIIDKYEGDAIMAEFGVPVMYPRHAHAACTTALSMQRQLHHLRKSWATRGLPQLHARIGINTGEVIVGNMGSRDVFDYTVMGDSVNLGARLEGANKFYSTNIMISEFTNELIQEDFLTRPLDYIRVKGKKKPIQVFELIADRKTKYAENFVELMGIYFRGYAAYTGRSWNDAADIFDHCLKVAPDDKPSQLYRQRCHDYKKKPPPEDWDGVTIMTEK